MRRHTALYVLKSEAMRAIRIVTTLTEGLSVSGAMRTFDPREYTLTTWLLRAGDPAARLHDRPFRTLRLLVVSRKLRAPLIEAVRLLF